MRVLVTGGAGRVATLARPGLRACGHELRLFDIQPVEVVAGEQMIVADIGDADAVAAAVEGTDAVVHLAGALGKGTATHQFDVDVRGTFVVFEQARRAGVDRIVYASSNHAAGFTPRDRLVGVDGVDGPPRPDTLYGVNKVFGEALGRYYHDRYGMRLACVRIGTALPEPRTPRMLATWLSPGDAGRLLHACLTAADLGYAVVWGISANTRAWWDLSGARALGYAPQDDSETYAAQILAEHGESDPADPDWAFLGGAFTTRDVPEI